MKFRYVLILIFIISFLWVIPHLLIHEFGHAIACVLLGGRFDRFEFMGSDFASFGMCVYCEYKYDWSRPVISAAGSLTVIIFISIIAQLKKSIITAHLQYLSILVDGIYWIIGGWFPASDVKTFCRLLEFDAKIFGLCLIPLLVCVIYLSVRRICRQLDNILSEY